MSAHQDDSPIEAYLDQLLGSLRTDPARARRIVAEADDHLHEAADRLVREGLSRPEAEARAVQRFGSASAVALSHGALGIRDLIRPVVGLGALGLIAIGVSGLVSEVFGRIWGADFVAGDLPGASYTPARCAEFIEYFPGRSCLDAAAMHHWGEVVQYRVAAGVLGLLALLVFRLLPRHRALPRGLVPVVGACAFVLAAGGLSWQTFNAAWQSSNGVGAWLSADIVAVIAGAALLLRGWRDVRKPVASS